MSSKNHRSIYLPKEAWEDLEKIAIIQEKNVNQLVKDVIEDYLKEYKA